MACVLGVWLGALGMTAASAATIFPVMKGLDPTLPGFAGYVGGHWSIAAGMPMQRIFAVFDGVQLVCCVAAAGLAAAGLLRGGRRDPLELARGMVLGLAFVGVVYYLLLLTPEMAADLRAFWEAAGRGDGASAEGFRAAFEARHPTANRLLGGIGAGVLSALALTLVMPERRAS
jgi:hypothetical protein